MKEDCIHFEYNKKRRFLKNLRFVHLQGLEPWTP